MRDKIKTIGKNLKHEINFYQTLSKDSRVPTISKVFIASAIFYFLLPFDLIPDFIPVVGHIDDLVIIPMLIYVALKFIPAEVIAEARQRSKPGESSEQEGGA